MKKEISELGESAKIKKEVRSDGKVNSKQDSAEREVI